MKKFREKFSNTNWTIFKILIIVVPLLLFLYGFIIYKAIKINNENKETRTYCGLIIERGKEEPTSGYKSHSDAVYFLIMRDRESNKNIRIEVTVPTYYSCEIGTNTCFELELREFRNYGNGYSHLK